MNDKQQKLLSKIKSSKKYTTLNEATVSRAIEDIARRHPEKQWEEQVKSKLHQIWGAYYTTRPNFQKLLKKIEEQKQQGHSTKEMLKPILQIHASTNERLPFLDDFYIKIKSKIGTPTKIIDYACGLNPLALPWMSLPATSHYTAYDIDIEEVSFINKVLEITQLNTAAQAKVGDIFDYTNEEAEVIFLLKFLPNVEQQQKGAAKEILQKLQARYLVISFPIKSLGGINKGMEDNYALQYEELFNNLNYAFDKLLFPTELVYVVKKTS